jgi:hypothetical protein
VGERRHGTKEYAPEHERETGQVRRKHQECSTTGFKEAIFKYKKQKVNT